MNIEDFKLPENAFQPKPDTIRYDNIDEWFCPDCWTNGDGSTVDFIEDHRNGYDIEGRKRVTYCCSACFEENIYITTIKA